MNAHTVGEGGAELVDALVDELLTQAPPTLVDRRVFWGAQYDLGLAWVNFPLGCGGLGIDPQHQRLVDERLAYAGAPSNYGTNILGVGMAAPTIVDHGTVAQQQRWLRPLFTCDEIWCQLFSEPGAGSDLASVRTTAVRDGEEWVVNGQKVWTTLGHMARWGLLLARTEAAAERHRGLTYFVCDMRQPGVEVRPLRQLTGDAEFNEVFLTDARVSDDERIGAVGDGWAVAMTTLMHERVSIGGGVQPRGTGPISAAVEAYDRYGRPSATRQRLLQLWVATEAARLTNLRALRLRERGTPGPEGSVAKILFAELAQKVYDFTLDVMGADGMLFDHGYAMTSPEESVMIGGEVRYMFLRSRGNSIEGGTSEIMRNILGERVLGLPKEPSRSSTSNGS